MRQKALALGRDRVGRLLEGRVEQAEQRAEAVLDAAVGRRGHQEQVPRSIGRQGAEEISAEDIAAKAGTIQYEFLTRINPQIERKLVK